MNDALAEVFDDLSSVLRAEQLVAKVAQLADAVHSEFQATFADYEAGLAKPETWKANVNDGVVRSVFCLFVRGRCCCGVRNLLRRIEIKMLNV